jgi:uncharacterized phage-associated protein
MGYDGRAVANLLLDLADEQGLSLTHMAIHKIAYFAHGWTLAKKNSPLVNHQFEAWKYGPVIASVYRALKGIGDAPVKVRVNGFDPVLDVSFPVFAAFDPSDRDLIRDVLNAYGRMPATKLSDITHRPGGAWDQVWNAPGGKITLGMRIPDDAIRREFLRRE